MTLKEKNEEYPDTLLSVQSFLFTVLAMAVGMLVAVVVLPTWMPNLAKSLLGPDAKVYWYLSRGTAFVSLSLLWLSMVLGLLMSNKMARSWPGVAVSFAIHEFVSLLGLGFAMFHAIILMGDKYIEFTLEKIATPFASTYEPFWVGVGQISFYIMLLVAFSFYVRKIIGQKLWRVIHFISFLTYLMALLHSLAAGTDTEFVWAQQYYWVTGGSLLFFLMVRIVSSFFKEPVKRMNKSASA
ncbi:MAG: hypothetical protein GY755_07215 [Chloroflexi bacterium]|nr:hypothetical protein [Chloroflexota bacterium]